MEQGKDSRKGKRRNREERIVMERMSRGGIPPRDIAVALGRHRRTIERERARGQLIHMDLIAGPTRGSDAALLTLVERKSRQVLLRKLPDKSQASVLKALPGIERHYDPKRFRKLFRSITADNGAEFLDFKALETSSFSSRPRTRLF